MKTLKVKILNEFGMPLNLKNASEILFKFPYLDHRILTKRNANVVDADESIVEVTLDEMDINGLNEGKEQNFKAEVVIDGVKHTVLFAKSLNVEIKNGKKVINERHASN